MNKAYFRIQGKEFAILTDDDPAYVTELGGVIDRDIRELLSANDKASLVDSLVLCALKYLDEKTKNNASSDNMRKQVTDYLEEANKVRIELAQAKAEIARLQGAKK